MSLKLLLLTIVASLVMTCAQASDQAPGNQPRIGRLACGGASLTAETVYLDLADQDRQTLSQRITLARADLPKALALPSDARPLRQPFLKHTPVLDAAVTGWACLAAGDGKRYIYMLYTCVESAVRPACEGDRREWVRLFDVYGRPLNAGFPHTGAKTPALMKKLGLGRYVDDGVSLQDVDG